VDRTRSGQYGSQMFGAQVVRRIQEHKAQSPEKPLFLYFPIQNVHAPLESIAQYTESSACKNIVNADRKTFCGMANAADEAIGNMTAALETAFPGEDIVMVISGDNGGMPQVAGNQCPTLTDPNCLRGHKAEMWEGGIRNNALLCSKTMLPSGRSGKTYSKGLVHMMDWHATLRTLAGAQDKETKPVDGVSVWDAITKDEQSPRTEFLVNVDPCSGHGSCNGQEAAYHFQGCLGGWGGASDAEACGHWKLLSGNVQTDSWYAVPTSTSAVVASVETPASHGVPGPSGSVLFLGNTTNSSSYLYNISADPGEHLNLADLYPSVVSALQAKIDALTKQAVPACNIAGGSCYDDDSSAAAVLTAAKAWVPWKADAVTIQTEVIV